MLTSLRTNQRRGFTLVELLVVIAIIGILVGLLLPAVQAARESARRMKCGNNLKQLGLAAQSHHDTFQHLPPGIGYYPTADNGVFGTYLFYLLPFIEQGNLFDSALGSVPFPPPQGPANVYYPGNNNVYSKPVPTFLCPSDISYESGGVVTVDGATFGATCYVVNALLTARTDPASLPIEMPQGKTNYAAILDGTSNTILHGEKYARCTNSTMKIDFQDGGSAWAYCVAPFFPWLPAPMQPPGKAFQPAFAIPALVPRGAPNAIGPGSIFQVRPKWRGFCDPTRASTPHTGGLMVGLADGSVRNLSPNMSGVVWWAAVTPAGGEVLGAGW